MLYRPCDCYVDHVIVVSTMWLLCWPCNCCVDHVIVKPTMWLLCLLVRGEFQVRKWVMLEPEVMTRWMTLFCVVYLLSFDSLDPFYSLGSSRTDGTNVTLSNTTQTVTQTHRPINKHYNHLQNNNEKQLSNQGGLWRVVLTKKDLKSPSLNSNF